MDRWTVKKLNNTGDIDFAIAILNERKIKLNPFSPLGSKISSAVTTLEKLKNEQGTDAKKPEISVRRGVILDFIKFEAETAVVWPWAMPAEKMLQDEAFLSTLEEAVTFDESGSCDTEGLL